MCARKAQSLTEFLCPGSDDGREADVGGPDDGPGPPNRFRNQRRCRRKISNVTLRASNARFVRATCQRFESRNAQRMKANKSRGRCRGRSGCVSFRLSASSFLSCPSGVTTGICPTGLYQTWLGVEEQWAMFEHVWERLGTKGGFDQVSVLALRDGGAPRAPPSVRSLEAEKTAYHPAQRGADIPSEHKHLQRANPTHRMADRNIHLGARDHRPSIPPLRPARRCGAPVEDVSRDRECHRSQTRPPPGCVCVC